MKVKGNFELKCSCGKNHLFTAEEANFECVESHERAMGQENHHAWGDTFQCDCCNKEIEIEYGVWEYPVGAFNYENIKIENGDPISKFEYCFC
jgi:hypothetical protein